MNTYLPFDAPVLIIIGPSAAGKSTIVRILSDRGIIAITPTWTDRPRRPGEEALEHHFVDAKTFDAHVEGGLFAHQPLTFFGLPYRYAAPRLLQPPAGKVPAVMARVSALPLCKKLYPNHIIYQVDAPRDDVATRLSQRSEDGIALGSRLDDYEREVALGRQKAHRVFTNDSSPEAAANAIAKALIIDFPAL